MPVSIAALAGIPTDEAGLASGLINTSQQIGGALGVAILTTVAVSRANHELADGASNAVASTAGYQLAFYVAAAFAVANLIATLLILHRRELDREPEPARRRRPVDEGRSSVSTEQRETLDAILRQSAFPVGSDVNEQRRLLRELVSAQPLPAEVTVTAAALGGVPTAEITVDGVEPRHVVLYFHGGVYVIGDAFLAAELASQVGRRTHAKVISVDYRLAPEHPYPAAVDDALAAYEALLRQRRRPFGNRLRGRVRRRRPRHRHPGQRP